MEQELLVRVAVADLDKVTRERVLDPQLSALHALEPDHASVAHAAPKLRADQRRLI